jgi:Domain of unknown function (DUF2017)
MGARIERNRKGEFRLRLPAPERDALRAMPDQLRTLLTEQPDDPSLYRLFPVAYQDDPARDEEYRRLMHDELLEQHLTSLGVMQETVDADRLTEEQAVAWLSAMNDLRLVLGTRLDVSEETYEGDIDQDDPRFPQLAMYSYLGFLEEQLVAALAAALPRGDRLSPGDPDGG